ncbi:MAG TPA: hypothetical protein VNU21_15805 [Usitatibacter sp.]|nr:hypothetical protein [Usitatibacter sp.]
MNIRTCNKLIGAALAVATAGLTAQAADQSRYFEEQRMISDGYFPQYNVAPRHHKQESAWTAAQNAQFVKERIADSNGSKPQKYVGPARPPFFERHLLADSLSSKR